MRGNVQRVIVEAKFWAELTQNQPVTYLARLPADGGALVVITPAQRLTLLWGELVRRCKCGGLTVVEVATSIDEVRLAAIGSSKLVALSWRVLLGSIAVRLDADDDRAGRDDVRQLQGLCERMDTDAFLPLSPEELTSPVYRRIVEFGSLVDDVTARLVESGIASTQRLRATGGNGYYGRYLRLGRVGAFLTCHLWHWRSFASTPMWLTIMGQSWSSKDTATVRQALAKVETEKPPRLFLTEAGFVTVALHMRVGVERSTVETDLVTQVVEIATLLAPLGREAASSGDDPPPEIAV